MGIGRTFMVQTFEIHRKRLRAGSRDGRRRRASAGAGRGHRQADAGRGPADPWRMMRWANSRARRSSASSARCRRTLRSRSAAGALDIGQDVPWPEGWGWNEKAPLGGAGGAEESRVGASGQPNPWLWKIPASVQRSMHSSPETTSDDGYREGDAPHRIQRWGGTRSSPIASSAIRWK